MNVEAEPAAPALRSPWAALVAIVLGTTMVSLDSTIVNVALPTIGAEMGVGDGIEWVITVYLLGIAVAQPATGWMADRFGRRAVFITSVTVFTLASLGCAPAPNLGVLIVFRAIQGLGGGSIIPVSMAIVFEIFPKHLHGRAVSTWSMAGMLAPAFGPTVGGWLVTEFSWHWLFIINVPIGIVAIYVSRRVLPFLEPQPPQRLDAFGLTLGAGGLSLVVLGVSQGSSWGWASLGVAGPIIVGVVMLIWFVRRSLASDHPVLAVSLLRERPLQIVIGVLFLLQTAAFARNVFVPLELAAVRGYTPMRIGVILLPGALVMVVCMKYGGRLIDRLGVRLPAVLGLSLMSVGALTLSTMRITTPDWAVALLLCLQGGFGFAIAANIVAGMSELPQRLLAQGAALRMVAIQTAGALAVGAYAALSTALIGDNATAQETQDGYNVIFIVSALVLIPAIALATRLPKGSPNAIVDGDVDSALPMSID